MRVCHCTLGGTKACEVCTNNTDRIDVNVTYSDSTILDVAQALDTVLKFEDMRAEMARTTPEEMSKSLKSVLDKLDSDKGEDATLRDRGHGPI